MGAPVKQGDERDGVNSSQAPSVGANRVPEYGGNIRGSKKEYQRQELASLAPQGRRRRPGGPGKKAAAPRRPDACAGKLSRYGRRSDAGTSVASASPAAPDP